ncbi:MAG: TetR/AcrR family transcriptional regulator [Muribaculaceae bacterium]
MDQRERILRTTYDLLAQFGITSVTMDLIAKECGISKRTLYELFSDKNTLIIDAVNLIYEDRNKKFYEIIETSPNEMISMLRIYTTARDFISGVCQSFFIDMERLYPKVAKNYKELENTHIARFVKIIDKGKEEGVFCEGVNSDIVATLYILQFQNIKKSQELFLSRYSSVEIFDNIFLNFVKGMSTQRGLEIMADFFNDKKNK